MSEDAKYKVGLIGAGRAGVPRARAFDMHPLCKVVAIADTDRANLELAAGRFGVPGYETWEEMLENHDLDIGMAVLPCDRTPMPWWPSRRPGSSPYSARSP